MIRRLSLLTFALLLTLGVCFACSDGTGDAALTTVNQETEGGTDMTTSPVTEPEGFTDLRPTLDVPADAAAVML
jgi:hypothetical protein